MYEHGRPFRTIPVQGSFSYRSACYQRAAISKGFILDKWRYVNAIHLHFAIRLKSRGFIHFIYIST